MNHSEQNSSFVDRVLKTTGIVIFSVLVLALFYYAFDVVMLVFAAILFAVFLRGLSTILRRFIPVGEGVSVLIVAGLLIVIVGGAVALLSPSVAEQVKHLREELPESARQATDYISQFRWGQAILKQLPTPTEIVDMLTTSTFLTNVGGIFSSTIGMVGNFFIGVLLAVYLAAEPNFYLNGLTKLFPKPRRRRIREVLEAIGETLSWWLIGKAGSMLFIGILTWIGLSILGVPLALTLGLIAGLLSFIPNFGPIISALPALLLAFIESPVTSLYVLVLFIVVQIIESNIVTPIIERETVEMPPALTVVAQLVLAVTIGGMGLILATPLLATIMVGVQMLYIEDVLGDPNTDAAENLDDKEFEGADDVTEESDPNA